MAPIKFEENIKDKLEKRTLSPSSDSWSKLSERLDNDEKKSKKSIFWWLSIAAGLLIMMAISVQFFNTNEAEEIMPQVVEETVIEAQLNTKSTNQDHKKSIELVNEENRVEEKNEVLPTTNDSKIIEYKKAVKNQTKKNIKLAEQNDLKETKNLPNNTEQIKQEQQNVIDNALMEEALAAAMQDLKNEKTGVTDREIDSLLKVASKELFKENLSQETTKITDAETLLQSVEEEMGQSFRTKVFEALKESYKTVKTAVADRNN